MTNKFEYLNVLAYVRPELGMMINQTLHIGSGKAVRILTTLPIFSSADAGAMIGNMKPKIVMVDAGVEGFNLPALRELRLLSESPILIVGLAEAGSSDREDMLGAGLDAVYSTPLSNATLELMCEELPEKYEITAKGWKKGAWNGIAPDEIREATAAAGGSSWTRMCIAVWSPKGGVGKTTMSIEMSAALAAIGGRKVALVDANMNGGHIRLRLNIQEEKNILTAASHYQMSKGHESLKRDLNTQLRNCMVPVHGATNLHVLPGVANMDQSRSDNLNGEAGVEFMGYLINFLKRNYDFVVIDMGSSINVGVHYGAIQEADSIMVVATPDLTSLSDAKQGVHRSIIPTVGITTDRFNLVMNMWQDNLGVDLSQASEFTEITAIGSIPNAISGLVTLAGNEGQSFVAKYAGEKNPPAGVEVAMGGFVMVAAHYFPPIAAAWSERNKKKTTDKRSKRGRLFSRKA